MAVSDDILRPFAIAIHAKASALRTLSLTERERARLTESISDDIRKCSDLVEPAVSRKAHELASKMGIDLYSKGWHDQPAFDSGRARFLWEHVLPVAEVRGCCAELESADQVREMLRRRLKVAWLLRSEDAELTRLGYRSRRPDPEGAYRDAGIELLRQPTG
jgi:hypothetical protein